MNRAAPAVVAGIQRLEQLDHLTASYFSHHESVRPHAQRLPDEVTQGDSPGAVEVGRPRLQAYDVWMIRAKFGGVFDENDPLRGRCLRQEGGEHGGLASTSAARYEKRDSRLDETPQGHGGGGYQRADLDKLIKSESTAAWDSKGYAGPAWRDGWNDRMEPNPVCEPRVDIWAGVIEAPAAADR